MTATFTDIIGAEPRKCGHPRTGLKVITRPSDPAAAAGRVPDGDAEAFAEWRDWVYASGLIDDAADATSAVLCDDCYYASPSRVAERRRLAQIAAEREQAREDDVAEMVASGLPLLLCPSCDEPFYAEDAVPVRYCPHCEQTFDASGGRNCTECNRPFSRRVTDLGHEACADDWGEDGDAAPYAPMDRSR